MRADLDWYLISIDRLRLIAAILVLALVSAGVWYYVTRVRNDPANRARAAVSSAQESIRDLAASPGFESFRNEYERARRGLAQAQQLLAQSQWGPAESAANEARTLARTALARQQGASDADAQFLSVEGDVQYQKSGGEWRTADARTPLYNGDWVRTAGNASAELIFSNGSLYTIGPDALLEIYSTVNPQTSRKSNAVQMQVGSIEINTTDDVSTVRTPGTEVVIGSDSTTQVGVAREDRTTRVMALRGSATVGSGPARLELTGGEAVSAAPTGELSNKETFLPAPVLVSPPDNLVLRIGANPRVEFSWQPVQGAARYRVQVARSRLFSAPEIDASRDTPDAAAAVSAEGVFYWRVAAVSPAGVEGPFSPFRRFRVTGVETQPEGPASGDRTPPTLELNRPFNIGGAYYMIEGTAEAGSTVFVNDEVAETSADGRFRKLVSFTTIGWNTVTVKAVDPAGNETVRTERVHVKD